MTIICDMRHTCEFMKGLKRGFRGIPDVIFNIMAFVFSHGLTIAKPADQKPRFKGIHLGEAALFPGGLLISTESGRKKRFELKAACP